MAKKKTVERDRGDWASPTSDQRHRPMLSVTVSRKGKAALDKLSKLAGYSRGVTVEACILAQSDAAASGGAALGRLRMWCAVAANRPGDAPKTDAE